MAHDEEERQSEREWTNKVGWIATDESKTLALFAAAHDGLIQLFCFCLSISHWASLRKVYKKTFIVLLIDTV